MSGGLFSFNPLGGYNNTGNGLFSIADWQQPDSYAPALANISNYAIPNISSINPNVSAPVTGFGGSGNDTGFSFGMGDISRLLGGIGSLYSAYSANKLGQQQLKLARDQFERNYANQVKSYNTALKDRITSRGVMEGQSQDQVNTYVEENSL